LDLNATWEKILGPILDLSLIDLGFSQVAFRSRSWGRVLTRATRMAGLVLCRPTISGCYNWNWPGDKIWTWTWIWPNTQNGPTLLWTFCPSFKNSHTIIELLLTKCISVAVGYISYSCHVKSWFSVAIPWWWKLHIYILVDLLLWFLGLEYNSKHRSLQVTR